MPTLEQIRAARALLGWSQSDLAERAGLSQTGIARIENGTNQPNSQTLSKIEMAFEENNIEFLDTSGVRKKTGDVKIFRDQAGIRAFFDEVYEEVNKYGGDVCLFNGVPHLLIQWLGQEWYDHHAERMKLIKANFDFPRPDIQIKLITPPQSWSFQHANRPAVQISAFAVIQSISLLVDMPDPIFCFTIIKQEMLIQAEAIILWLTSDICYKPAADMTKAINEHARAAQCACKEGFRLKNRGVMRAY